MQEAGAIVLWTWGEGGGQGLGERCTRGRVWEGNVPPPARSAKKNDSKYFRPCMFMLFWVREWSKITGLGGSWSFWGRSSPHGIEPWGGGGGARTIVQNLATPGPEPIHSKTELYSYSVLESPHTHIQIFREVKERTFLDCYFHWSIRQLFKVHCTYFTLNRAWFFKSGYDHAV